MKDEEGVVPAAIKEIAARVAKSVVKGQIADISKSPTPAYLHHCITQLGLIKNDLSYSRKWLKAAANEKDPVERMKKVIAFYMAPHTINPAMVACRIPLNPILGETLQRELPTGEKVYLEQISHHPAISAFLLEDPDGDYRYHGHCTYKAWLNGANSVGGGKDGIVTIDFKDGTKYEISDPILIVNNVISGGQYQ